MVDFLGCADLFDAAAAHDDDAVGEFEGFFLIVGDEDAGDVDFIVQAPSQSRNSLRTRASRAPNGSSRSRTLGRAAKARARATRCRWPPDSCDGIAIADASSWISFSSSVTALADLLAGLTVHLRARSRCCRRRSCGGRERNVERRSRCYDRGRTRMSASSPARVTLPVVGGFQAGDDAQERRLARARRAQRAISAPLGISRLTLSSATWLANCLHEVLRQCSCMAPLPQSSGFQEYAGASSISRNVLNTSVKSQASSKSEMANALAAAVAAETLVELSIEDRQGVGLALQFAGDDG